MTPLALSLLFAAALVEAARVGQITAELLLPAEPVRQSPAERRARKSRDHIRLMRSEVSA